MICLPPSAGRMSDGRSFLAQRALAVERSEEDSSQVRFGRGRRTQNPYPLAVALSRGSPSTKDSRPLAHRGVITISSHLSCARRGIDQPSIGGQPVGEELADLCGSIESVVSE